MEALACRPRIDEGARVDRVLLVTIDGVRWQEIARGIDPELAPPSLPRSDARRLVPTIYALAERGAGTFEEMRTSAPRPVSLPGYREILTGRRGERCFDNRCPPIDEPTLLDELVGAGVPADEVAMISSWEGVGLAAAAAPEAASVSAGRHGGASRARVAGSPEAARLLAEAEERHDFVAHEDYRRDADTMALALRYFIEKQPRFLHVALGDTDEWAHVGNYQRYVQALAAADAFLGRLLEAARALGGETLVLVTTDHGRATGFRDHGQPGDTSERVWMVAAGGPIRARGFQRPPAPRRLADLAPTVRAILGLPADHSPRAGVVLEELLEPVALAGSAQAACFADASAAPVRSGRAAKLASSRRVSQRRP